MNTKFEHTDSGLQFARDTTLSKSDRIIAVIMALFLTGLGILVYWLIRYQFFANELILSRHLGIWMFVGPIFAVGFYLVVNTFTLKSSKISSRWKRVTLNDQGIIVEDLYGRTDHISTREISSFFTQLEETTHKRTHSHRKIRYYYLHLIIWRDKTKLKFELFGKSQDYDHYRALQTTINEFCQHQLGWTYNEDYSRTLYLREIAGFIYFLSAVLLLSGLIKF